MEPREKWHFDHLKEVHKKKLDLINSNSSKRIDNSPPSTLQLAKNRVASYQNLRNQEFHEIYRKNQVILDALQEISNRKVKNKQIKTQNHFTPAIKSLNINFRNKISRKIIEENELILQKLSSKGSTISVKKFDDDFKLSLQYKKNLTRRLLFESPKKNFKKKKLPRIERTQDLKKKLRPNKSESALKDRKTELPRTKEQIVSDTEEYDEQKMTHDEKNNHFQLGPEKEELEKSPGVGQGAYNDKKQEKTVLGSQNDLTKEENPQKDSKNSLPAKEGDRKGSLPDAKNLDNVRNRSTSSRSSSSSRSRQEGETKARKASKSSKKESSSSSSHEN